MKKDHCCGGGKAAIEGISRLETGLGLIENVLSS